jgi:hypothetical protein
MTSAGCNRTRRDFFLSCHHKSASTVAVRSAKRTKLRIAAIAQPTLHSVRSQFADFLAAARRLPRPAAFYCRFVTISRSKADMKNLFGFII